jgi:sortase B
MAKHARPQHSQEHVQAHAAADCTPELDVYEGAQAVKDAAECAQTVQDAKPETLPEASSGSPQEAIPDSPQEASPDSPQEQSQQAPQSKHKKVLISVTIFVIVIAACVGAYFGYNAYNQWRIEQDAIAAAQAAAQELAAKEAEEKEQPVQETVENPIDFATLQDENPDIYAWITIPGTNVDYAILQSSIDDNYYLRRDEYGNDAEYGALFTQSRNALDFSDPVTVVYGHCAADDAYFATLHYFENEDFFDSYQTMYVYTPTHCYTYQVIAAYQYDDRHILNSYDFSNESVRLSYFESVLNPESVLSNVREGVELNAESKLLQLSTCMSTYIVSNTRYIVTGVLVSEQVTY